MKKGREIYNTIHVLTYNCSKLLCVIYKSEKALLISNYYRFKKITNIVNNLNNQLGIQTKN